MPASRLQAFWWEFLLFGLKQAWACLFGGVLLMLVLLTKLRWPPLLLLSRVRVSLVRVPRPPGKSEDAGAQASARV